MVKNMILFRLMDGSDDLYRCKRCGRKGGDPRHDEKHGISLNPGFEPVEGEAI